MKNYCLIILILLFIASCSTPQSQTQDVRQWAVAIHGGAGHFGEEDMSEEMQLQYHNSLLAALTEGENLVSKGHSAVDVVEAVIRILEDDSLFNAGRGAVFTSEATHELDASIADGHTRNCGAVTGIKGFKHPISVAKSVMDSSEHVFFSGHGAAEFAAALDHETAEPNWFHTEKAYDRYELAALRNDDQPIPLDEKRGTVGCVVLDTQGHLAAGTSTGGMTYKKHGRIGDSPVIGAGTWADDRTCAVSSTGWGEYFIRTGVAHDVHSRMLYNSSSLESACEGAIFQEMGQLGGDGGVIAISSKGEISLVCNTPGMFRGWAIPGEKGVAMFGLEETGTIESH